MQSKILAFAGSAKKEPFNKRLVESAAIGAKEAGAIDAFRTKQDEAIQSLHRAQVTSKTTT